MKKKNVMFIIGTMRNGGAERAITNICNSLKDKYNIILVAREIDNCDYLPDVKVFEIKELSGGRRKIIGIWKLRRLKKKYNIDTSISFMARSNIINYFSRYREKVVISIRNHMSSNPNSCSVKDSKYLKYIIGKVDLIVNVSKSVMFDQMKKYNTLENKNITITNFCDIESINKLKNKKLPKKYEELFKNDVIISLGRFSDQKGQWHLIRAFTKVIEVNPNAKLVLMGRGYLKDYYQSLIDDLNLGNSVFIIDFDSNPYKYLAKSKLLILNSFYEGMPNVVLEAMACGVPVIGSDSPGGTKEILDPDLELNSYVNDIMLAKYGILIPICDRIKYEAKDQITKQEMMIADSINLLLKDKRLYNKYKKQSKIRINDFTKDKVIGEWEKII